MAATTIDVVIDEQDIDALGHANNTTYVRLFERGRMHFYHSLGLELERATPPRLGTVVVNLNVNFCGECFQGERLTISTQALRRGSKSYVLTQVLSKADGTVAADAEVTSVVMDLDKRTVVALPDLLAIAFEGT